MRGRQAPHVASSSADEVWTSTTGLRIPSEAAMEAVTSVQSMSRTTVPRLVMRRRRMRAIARATSATAVPPTQIAGSRAGGGSTGAASTGTRAEAGGVPPRDSIAGAVVVGIARLVATAAVAMGAGN